MPYDVCEIESSGEDSTARVDIWDATGRHWLYYFRREAGGVYQLASTAEVPYEGDRIEMERGIESAEENMRAEGFSVSPHDESE